MSVVGATSSNPINIFNLTPVQFAEMAECPICKKIVHINRHSKDLCAYLDRNRKKTQKSAQDALTEANRLNQ